MLFSMGARRIEVPINEGWRIYGVGREIVRSTRLQGAVSEGDFGVAAKLLDRPYSVLGPVVEGKRQGRELGFPTLNLVPEDPLPLMYGVYAVRPGWGRKPWTAFATMGSSRPWAPRCRPC